MFSESKKGKREQSWRFSVLMCIGNWLVVCHQEMMIDVDARNDDRCLVRARKGRESRAGGSARSCATGGAASTGREVSRAGGAARSGARLLEVQRAQV